MALIRITTGGQSDAEGITGASTGATGLSGDLARQTTNLALSQHIGNFVAGQVATQFQNENLADMMKGKNMIMISASWG